MKVFSSRQDVENRPRFSTTYIFYSWLDNPIYSALNNTVSILIATDHKKVSLFRCSVTVHNSLLYFFVQIFYNMSMLYMHMCGIFFIHL